MSTIDEANGGYNREIADRLKRLELAVAENTRMTKGDWKPPPGSSAAGDILAEQRARELQQQEAVS